MASSNQTPTFKLCQWLENDSVLREDFNADNSKVEQALVAHAATLNQLKPVFGSYTGTGKSNIQTITLGFSPSFLLIFPYGGYISNSNLMDTCMSIRNFNSEYTTITATGFTVTRAQNYNNAEGFESGNKSPYRYLAFR